MTASSSAASAPPPARQHSLLRHTNHYLFSDHYLDHRAQQRPDGAGGPALLADHFPNIGRSDS